MTRVLMLSTLHRHDDIRICHKESAALRRAGYRVLVACPGEPPEGSAANSMGLSVPRGRMARMAVGWLAGVKAGVASGAKVVHIHDPELLPAAVVLKALGKRVVYDAHEDLPKQVAHKGYLPVAVRPLIGWAADGAERAMARHMDLVVGATPRIAGRLSGIAVRNLPDARELRLVSVPKRNRQICYVGSISEARGAFVMAEAAWRAGAHLAMAGTCESETLRQRLEPYVGEGCLTLLGQVDREAVARLLCESHIGLSVLGDCPAYREALPIKLMEYMMAGLPFIASDFPGYRRIGQGGGLYVAPDDPEALAGAIRRILGDAALAKQLARAGKMASRKYDFACEERKLVGAYNQLTEERPCASC